jgi:hypothetical protein
MPGVLHQGILWLFEDDPWLGFDVLELVRPVDGTPVDRRAEAERDAPQLFRIHPYFPDLVLVYRDPDDDDNGIVMTIEGQVLPDYRKRYRIPVCQAVLADKHQLPTWPVVVAFSLQTATLVRSWAVGPPPKVEALVLATDNVPRVTSLERARQRPTLTALSAALHGCNGDLECVRVAIEAFNELSETKRRRYGLTVLAALPEREFEIVKGELQMQEHDPLWEIEKRSAYGQFFRREFGFDEEKTRKEALEEGRKASLVEMILTVLDVRGIIVDDDTAARVRSCVDLPELERWARRAREVDRAAQLFST